MTSSEPKIAYVIDSDVAIDYLRLTEYAVGLLTALAGEGFLAVSTLTHYEIYRGMRPGEENKTDTFLDSMVTLSVTTDIARFAGKLMNGIRSKGLTIDTSDAVIAATALSLNIPLVTNNISHYPFPNLRLIRGRGRKGEFLIRETRRGYTTRK
jgi:predicted nucleic acid-binding protein